MSDKSNNDKAKESTEFQKAGQKPQEKKGYVEVKKSLDVSSAYPIIQRVLSELNDKSDSNKDK
jgi:hypothetical protein